MNASSATLEAWYSTVSIDDITYASELLAYASAELTEQLENLDDCTEANAVLSRFML